jgi:hypothetical protein
MWLTKSGSLCPEELYPRSAGEVLAGGAPSFSRKAAQLLSCTCLFNP